MAGSRILLCILLGSVPEEIESLADGRTWDRIIVASRDDHHRIVSRMRSGFPGLEHLPLDLDAVFEEAKASHLDAMKSFRRILAEGQPRLFRRLWWLTAASLRHSFHDRLFDLFLCRQFQSMMVENHPGCVIRSRIFLSGPTAAARKIPWPVPTTIMPVPPEGPGASFGSRLRVLKKYGRKLFVAMRESPFGRYKSRSEKRPDLCFVCADIPKTWEDRNGRIRDLYYGDMPGYLAEKGLDICRVIPPFHPRPDSPARYEADIRATWSPADLLFAAAEAMLFGALLFRALVRHHRHLRDDWRLSVFRLKLISGIPSFFPHLLFVHAYRRLFRRLEPKAIIFYDEVYFFGREMLLAVSGLPIGLRCATIGLQHGVVSENQLVYATDPGDPGMRLPSCSAYFVFNEMSRRTCAALLPPGARNRVRITGYHRIRDCKDVQQPAEESLLEDVDPSRPVFLLLGGLLSLLEEIWKTLSVISKRRPLQLIVKPHQAHPFPDRWLRAFQIRTRSLLIYSERIDLDSAICAADYVISPLSTALINVISHRKRALLYWVGRRFDVMGIRPWFESQPDCAVVKNPEELEAAICRRLDEKPKAPAVFVDPQRFLPPFVGTPSLEAVYRSLGRLGITGARRA